MAHIRNTIQISYRIFPQPTGLFTVEIDPGDGSIMRSQSPCARYFNHWIVQYHPHQVLTALCSSFLQFF